MKDLVVVTISASYPCADLSYTLDSICMQSCKGFLLVLVISRISYGSMQLLSSSLDSCKITYELIANQDSSLYDAMNRGLDVAGGRPALFLNSGDRFFNSNAVSTIASKYAKNAANAFSIINTFDGKVGYIRLSNPAVYRRTGAYLFKKFILHSDSSRLPPHPALVSNYVFETGASARFPLGCSYHADSLLLKSLLRDADVIYHDEPVIVFHLDGVSSKPSFRRSRSYFSRKLYARSVFELAILGFAFIVGQRRYFELVNLFAGNKKVLLSRFS